MRRLYEKVSAVRWQELAGDDEAATREADIIVALRPAFNASHSLDGRWNHVTVSPHGRGHRFELTTAPGERSYGCFPHLGRGVSSVPAIACRDGYTAFLRLLWAASGATGSNFPSRITRSAPDRFDVGVAPSLLPPLHAFLSGTSCRLLDQLAAASADRPPQLQPGLAADRAAAEAFFVHGPRAVRRLRLRHRQPAGPMSRETIEARIAEEVRDAIGPFHVRPVSEADALLGRRARRWAVR